ncbi:hypothetical protein [Micromonospora sp. NPDC050695]|uniref:hypothetical protein n=1 Tax=Micromonospora sp. NPDC050695 TaxID=3154938 RepID=UPI0033F368B1
MDTNELARMIAGLPKKPPIERARLARDLVDEAKRLLSTLADEAIEEATRSESYASVAEKLGKTVATVNKAVSRHRNPGMRDRKK